MILIQKIEAINCYDVLKVDFDFDFFYFFIKCMQFMTMTLFRHCVYVKLHVI